MAKKWQSQKFELQAILDIDGKQQQFEIRRMVASFELNKIPTCQLSLPLGVEIDTQAPAPAHELARQVSLRIPAKVYLVTSDPQGDLQKTFGLTDDKGRGKEILIFEGDVTGIGYTRSAEGYNQVLNLTHWLGRLNDSSTLSESSHPQNPTQFSFNSALTADAGGNQKAFTTPILAQRQITATTIKEDLWAKGIQPWFLELAKKDRLTVKELGARGNEDSSGVVTDVLNRITTTKEAPLKLKTGTVDTNALAVSIAKQLSVRTLDPQLNSNHILAMAHVTFWGKLIGDLGPLFMFSLVPRPSDALLVPFIPGLQDFLERHTENIGGQKVSYTLAAQDIQSLDISTTLIRPLRAVAVLGGQTAMAGGNLGPKERWNQFRIGGLFAPREDGMVVFKRAPAYLAEIIDPSKYTALSAGLGNKVKGNAVHPKAGEKAAGNRPGKIKNDTKSILDAVAQTLYINEVLVARQGTVSTPLRLDICPGSTIKIQAEPELFGGALANGPKHFARYATVIRTTLLLDRESNRAGSAFQLAHVRTEDEFNDKATSVAGHPLYSTTWVGANLVD